MAPKRGFTPAGRWVVQCKIRLTRPLSTILDIARLLNRILGKSIEPQVTRQGRLFDIRHNTADITRARTALGFAPKVSLEQGFSELVEWAKTTPDVAMDFFDKALDELKEKGLLA